MQPAAPPRPRRAHWPAALLFGLLFVLLLLIAAWGLRIGAPVDPSLRVETVEPLALPPPPPPPDPTPVLKASLDDLQSDSARLATELAALGDDLKRKVEACRVAAAPPPPPPPPPTPRPVPPQAAPMPAPSPPPAPPPTSTADLPADRWASRDLGVLQGCWYLGRDAPTVVKGLGAFGGAENCTSKAGRICFDANGRGRREQTISCPSSGTISCAAPVMGQFGADGAFRTTQPDVSCHGGSGPPTKWFSRTLSCRRDGDNQASCRDSGRPELGFPAQDQEFRRAP